MNALEADDDIARWIAEIGTEIGPAPRDVRLKTKLKVIGILVSLFILALDGILIAAGIEHLGRLERLRDHGVVTTGTVLSKAITKAGKSRRRGVVVEFSHPGGRRTDDKSVNEDVYDRVTAGAPVEITYDPDDPSRNEIFKVTADSVKGHSTTLALVGAALFGIELIFAVIFFTKFRRYLRLAENGVLVAGEILSVEKKRFARRHRATVEIRVVPRGMPSFTLKTRPSPGLIGGMEVGTAIPVMIEDLGSTSGEPLAELRTIVTFTRNA